MAERLSDLAPQIKNKTQAGVEALLGKPIDKGFWSTNEPPPGATPAQVAAHARSTLDEIWIYTNGRVHFSIAGKAIKVDDKTLFDQPPDQMLMA